MNTLFSRPAVRGKASILAVTIATLGLAGCDHLDRGAEHPAGQVLLTPAERHPILVSQEPHRMSVNVSRSSRGLDPGQRARIIDFVSRFHASDTGNSKLIIAVPSGAANEVAAMNAVADMRPLLNDIGVSESAISIEPYHADGQVNPPIRVAYNRYAADAPECGKWPENLGATSRNLNYANFGCASQRNMAAMIANPADLVGPRTMTPASAERRDKAYEKYIKDVRTDRTRTEHEWVTKSQ
ncbi:MAG TPA: CpaD family pilus assembly protein [Hyphomicrobiaceae bacterium]|nr:CpaD family pilus assembly protein [Hyphomicrobiaceae bacterium]